jgi:hypothetical protein
MIRRRKQQKIKGSERKIDYLDGGKKNYFTHLVLSWQKIVSAISQE